MTVLEFGKEKPRVLILLHGGGLSWWNYRKAAEKLSELFHVVLPVLDGHAGSDASFTSIEDNAARIIRYIDEHFGGEVTAIAGLSLGGQVALEILSQKADICHFALIESALVKPSRLTHALIAPSFSRMGMPWGQCFSHFPHLMQLEAAVEFLRSMVQMV